jgi:hypothetical protein
MTPKKDKTHMAAINPTESSVELFEESVILLILDAEAAEG